MTDEATTSDTRAFIVPAGGGRTHLVAGQIVRTLAGVAETAGGFGAVVCECPMDRGPIPMHWHEREHDTWFVTRGKLQVWSGDQSRVLTPGDFAYVVPGDAHSYRSVAGRTQFFGIVAPGGWEEFFADAGEVWGMTGLPPADRPFDFSRMGPAMGKHRIMRIDEPVYVDATPVDDRDRSLPGEHRSYYLDAGHGARRTLFGLLSTAVLTFAESADMLDMRTIEGGRDATVPTLRHAVTHVFLYVLDGRVALTLDGEPHDLTGGDAANVPAGTSYSITIVSGQARWMLASANGNGATMWDVAGSENASFSWPLEPATDDAARIMALSDVDVTLA